MFLPKEKTKVHAPLEDENDSTQRAWGLSVPGGDPAGKPALLTEKGRSEHYCFSL